MKAFVTGGAGFIGSNLVDRLLSRGHDVVVYDNLSTGHLSFLDGASKNPKFRFIKGDVLDQGILTEAMAGRDFVFHLAANADVRFGLDQPRRDLEQNTIATSNVLEAMRANKVMQIAFSSTGSIYGEAQVIPTPENAPLPIQTSLYGASKMACEGLISAYCEGYGMRGWIFRFVSILGERYTHGHVFDFAQRLSVEPTKLHILGNGRQKKSYLYIQDCLDAIECALENGKDKVNLFNLGTEEYCETNDSAGWICEELKVTPERTYAGGERGWVGDNPFIFLDVKKIRALGWKPKLTIKDAVVATVRYLTANPDILNPKTADKGKGKA